MIAAMKIAVLLLVAIIAMAMSAQARELLDYYDDCYNRECPSLSIIQSSRARIRARVYSGFGYSYVWPDDPRGSLLLPGHAAHALRA